MDERMKKALMSLGLRCALAAGLFLMLCILKWSAPEITEKISAVWTKNTDLKRAGELFRELFYESLPF